MLNTKYDFITSEVYSQFGVDDATFGLPIPTIDHTTVDGGMGDTDFMPAREVGPATSASAPSIPFSSLDPFGDFGGERPTVTYDGEITWQVGSGGTPGEQQMPYTVEIAGGSGTFAYADGTAGRVTNLELVDDRVTEVKSDAFGNPFEWQSGQAYEFDGVVTYTDNDSGLVNHHIMGHYEEFEGMQVVFDRLVEYEYGMDFSLEGVASGGLAAPHLNAEWMIEGTVEVTMQYVEAGYYIVEVTAEFAGEVTTNGQDITVEPAPYEAFFMVKDPDDFVFDMPSVISDGLADMANLLGPLWDSVGHFEGFLGETLAGAKDDGYYDNFAELENPFADSVPMPRVFTDEGISLF